MFIESYPSLISLNVTETVKSSLPVSMCTELQYSGCYGNDMGGLSFLSTRGITELFRNNSSWYLVQRM